MVPVLVLLTFAALVALNRFVLRNGYFEDATGWPEKLEILPEPAARDQVPADVYLQPTFTWARVGEWGSICVGIHPLLLRLIGDSGEVELLKRGERVAKGDPLVTLWRAGRHLTLRSPIAGRLVRVNRRVAEQPWHRDVEAGADGAPWLYRVRPEPAADETSLWLQGAAALEWTRRQYGQVRAYLTATLSPGPLGAVMADGGELPAGILGETDQGVWTGLEARFLAPGGAAATGYGMRREGGGEA